MRVWHLPPGWPRETGAGRRGNRFGITVVDNGGNGVIVRSVERRSPAATAEVDPGDIVLEVNGVKISNTDEMLDAVAKSPSKMKYSSSNAARREGFGVSKPSCGIER